MKSEDDDGKIVDFVEAREKLDAAFETAQEKVRQDAARFKQAYQDCLARGIVVELSDEQRELMTLLDSLESVPISRQRRMVASYLALVAQRRVESVKRKRTGAL
jgi:nitroimidazol reductase NimA-like FMN-containing flavoprotein (pyridoxamine 5'-phosphate oxidase superfamily)